MTTDRIGRMIARMIVAAIGAVLWHYGYHACAIGYFFFVILNNLVRIETAILKRDSEG